MADDVAPEIAQRTLWVSWESASGPREMTAPLLSLNQNGYLVLRIGAEDTLWIPLGRVYSLSTRSPEIAEAEALKESTASQAAAVIEAAAQGAADTSS